MLVLCLSMFVKQTTLWQGRIKIVFFELSIRGGDPGCHSSSRTLIDSINAPVWQRYFWGLHKLWGRLLRRPTGEHRGRESKFNTYITWHRSPFYWPSAKEKPNIANTHVIHEHDKHKSAIHNSNVLLFKTGVNVLSLTFPHLLLRDADKANSQSCQVQGSNLST